jgi:hypothetical protein
MKTRYRRQRCPYRKTIKNKYTIKKGGKVSAPKVINTHVEKTPQMACSPMIHRKSIKNSCYTPEILNTIKTEYNKSNPDNKIKETNPEKIWLELKNRLTHCEKEDCWLNQIKDEKMKKKIDRYIFAPDKPYEWKENPNEWLSNFDILNVLEQYEETYPNFEFIGPTPIDFDLVLKSSQCVYNELCKIDAYKLWKQGKTKIGIVFNLDKHDQGGSHWVSLFVDIDEGLIFYFDSAGARVPKEIHRLAMRIKTQLKSHNKEMRFIESYPAIHQHGNTECGMYSLFFIITMLTGKTEFQDNLTTKDKIALFKKHKLPDKYVEQYRNIYFND